MKLKVNVLILFSCILCIKSYTIESNLIEFFEQSSQIFSESNCTKQLQLFATYSRLNVYWATKVHETWGKAPIKMYDRKYFDFGQFDQCLSLNFKINSEQTFKGQHCQIPFGIIEQNETAKR